MTRRHSLTHLLPGGPRLKSGSTISVAEYRDLVGAKPKPNKYRNVKTVVDGVTFDSKAEAERYSALKLLERARVIRGLGLQPVFALTGPVGKHVAKYRADFCYLENGRHVVEDVKSEATLTALCRMKLRMFLQQHPDHELRLVDGKGRAIPFRVRVSYNYVQRLASEAREGA